MSNDRRESRHRVSIQGQFRSGSGKPRDVIVSDLSTKGCKFEDRFGNLHPGMIISIRIGSIGPIVAEVMWIDHTFVGVRFATALHSSILEHMLTTIEGWSSPDATPAGRGDAHDGARRFLLRVRPATIEDARAALAHARMTLPVSSHQDLVDLFHRILENVAIEVPEGEDPGR